jgi:mRNA-degrading endonuclease YafQ of YafQ-DinJ toxin-antitoxin module
VNRTLKKESIKVELSRRFRKAAKKLTPKEYRLAFAVIEVLKGGDKEKTARLRPHKVNHHFANRRDKLRMPRTYWTANVRPDLRLLYYFDDEVIVIDGIGTHSRKIIGNGDCIASVRGADNFIRQRLIIRSRNDSVQANRVNG